MDEPWNWYRVTFKREPTDLEALAMKPFSKDRSVSYKCSLLDRECKYDYKIGSGDCRRCVFALAQVMRDPDSMKREMEVSREEKRADPIDLNEHLP